MNRSRKARKIVTIRSFYGIGDLLFATPSFRVIKEAYPELPIHVNTCYPELLQGNPHVDRVARFELGITLTYPDPAHEVHPRCHNIIWDWKIICAHFGLQSNTPEIRPEIYLPLPRRGNRIRVQTMCNKNFHSKRVWPYLWEFCLQYGYDPIPQQSSLKDLVTVIAESRLVVCIDSGIQHIAKAVGTPCVVIYGGFSNPAWNGYESNINIVNFKKCSPCYNRRPCANTYQRECLREIGPEHVQQAVEQFTAGAAKNAERNIGSPISVNSAVNEYEKKPPLEMNRETNGRSPVS